jgi:cell division topological specificity factor
MNVFRSLQLAASAPVARERLQILLEYERELGSQIDLFGVLREEILAVISRHIVGPEKVQVTVDRGAKFSTLGVNVEIPNPGGKARSLPTDCVALQPDKTVGALGLRVKGQKRRGEDAAAGTPALPIWLVGGTVGAIVAVILGGWLYVQQRDVGKRRALDDRETALMAGFEVHVIAPRPAGGVVVETGPLVALRGTSGPEAVLSLPEAPAAAEPASQSAAFTPPAALESAMSPPHELPPVRDPAAAERASQSAAFPPPAALESAMSPPQELPPVRDPAAAEPAAQSAAFPPPAALESAMSPPQELPPVRDPAAKEPASQSAAVAPPAALGSATSPPNEQPAAPSQEASDNVTPLPPRRPLQIRIATPPRAVLPPALLRRRESP